MNIATCSRDRTPKDEKILAAALGGRADYLVSGNQDLLELAGHPALGRLQIVTARVSLEQIDEWGGSDEEGTDLPPGLRRRFAACSAYVRVRPDAG